MVSSVQSLNPLRALVTSRPLQVVTILLSLQTTLFYTSSRTEMVPAPQPLAAFRDNVESWSKTAEYPIEKEVQDVLRADDTLNRTYVNRETGASANLFIAFFRSQRSGVAPHSPKNCLPGSGWAPMASGTTTVSVPGNPEPLTINRYIVARGNQKSLVLYWYQTHNRVIASEYVAKIYLVLDSIRYNRSDTSLVRVVMSLPDGASVEDAEKQAADFIRSFYGPLKAHLPG